MCHSDGGRGRGEKKVLGKGRERERVEERGREGEGEGERWREVLRIHCCMAYLHTHKKIQSVYSVPSS